LLFLMITNYFVLVTIVHLIALYIIYPKICSWSFFTIQHKYNINKFSRQLKLFLSDSSCFKMKVAFTLMSVKTKNRNRLMFRIIDYVSIKFLVVVFFSKLSWGAIIWKMLKRGDSVFLLFALGISTYRKIFWCND
jgi:hypothetical protein